VCFLAPAKLNIFLEVFGRRADGFHDIRTVMVPVSVYDEVTVETGRCGIEVEADDPGVPADGRNTCWRAAELFMERQGAPAGARIRLRKRIPREAGLGGGSSDAAAVIKALSVLTGRPPGPGFAGEAAARVGADVPFFLFGGAALVEGLGERVTPVRWEVPFAAAIVKPPFGCPTGEAYARLGRPAAEAPPPPREVPAFCGWDDVAAARGNDFEAAWEAVRPRIRRLKEALLAAGAQAAGLTGSGSAVFGLFRREEEARRALRAIPAEGGEQRFVARNI